MERILVAANSTAGLGITLRLRSGDGTELAMVILEHQAADMSFEDRRPGDAEAVAVDYSSREVSSRSAGCWN
jgi:hypothetical protein